MNTAIDTLLSLNAAPSYSLIKCSLFSKTEIFHELAFPLSITPPLPPLVEAQICLPVRRSRPDVVQPYMLARGIGTADAVL